MEPRLRRDKLLMTPKTKMLTDFLFENSHQSCFPAQFGIARFSKTFGWSIEDTKQKKVNFNAFNAFFNCQEFVPDLHLKIGG